MEGQFPCVLTEETSFDGYGIVYEGDELWASAEGLVEGSLADADFEYCEFPRSW